MQRTRRSGISSEIVANSSASESGGSISGEIKVYPKTAEEAARVRGFIKDNILFHHLDSGQLQQVIDAFTRIRKNPQETIIRQGDDADYFYIVESGECEVFVSAGPSAPPKKVQHLKAGGSFGELALMYNSKRNATVVATTDVSLWALDRISFNSILKSTGSSKRKNAVEFLSRVKLLQGLTSEEYHKLADVMEEADFLDGAYIIRQGEMGDRFCILLEGQTVAVQDGREVKSYARGDCFGERALLTDEPRAASIISKGKSRVGSINRSAFDRLLGPCKDIMRRHMDAMGYTAPGASPATAVPPPAPNTNFTSYPSHAAPVATQQPHPQYTQQPPPPVLTTQPIPTANHPTAVASPAVAVGGAPPPMTISVVPYNSPQFAANAVKLSGVLSTPPHPAPVSAMNLASPSISTPPMSPTSPENTAGVGVCVTYGPDRKSLHVVSLLRNGPAKLSGKILSGDKVIAVNGIDVTNYTPAALSDLIRGPVGSEMTIIIERSTPQGPYRESVVLVRAFVPRGATPPPSGKTPPPGGSSSPPPVVPGVGQQPPQPIPSFVASPPPQVVAPRAVVAQLPPATTTTTSTASGGGVSVSATPPVAATTITPPATSYNNTATATTPGNAFEQQQQQQQQQQLPTVIHAPQPQYGTPPVVPQSLVSSDNQQFQQQQYAQVASTQQVQTPPALVSPTTTPSSAVNQVLATIPAPPPSSIHPVATLPVAVVASNQYIEQEQQQQQQQQQQQLQPPPQQQATPQHGVDPFTPSQYPQPAAASYVSPSVPVSSPKNDRRRLFEPATERSTTADPDLLQGETSPIMSEEDMEDLKELLQKERRRRAGAEEREKRLLAKLTHRAMAVAALAQNNNGNNNSSNNFLGESSNSSSGPRSLSPFLQSGDEDGWRKRAVRAEQQVRVLEGELQATEELLRRSVQSKTELEERIRSLESECLRERQTARDVSAELREIRGRREGVDLDVKGLNRDLIDERTRSRNLQDRVKQLQDALSNREQHIQLLQSSGGAPNAAVEDLVRRLRQLEQTQLSDSMRLRHSEMAEAQAQRQLGRERAAWRRAEDLLKREISSKWGPIFGSAGLGEHVTSLTDNLIGRLREARVTAVGSSSPESNNNNNNESFKGDDTFATLSPSLFSPVEKSLGNGIGSGGFSAINTNNNNNNNNNIYNNNNNIGLTNQFDTSAGIPTSRNIGFSSPPSIATLGGVGGGLSPLDSSLARLFSPTSSSSWTAVQPSQQSRQQTVVANLTSPTSPTFDMNFSPSNRFSTNNNNNNNNLTPNSYQQQTLSPSGYYQSPSAFSNNNNINSNDEAAGPGAFMVQSSRRPGASAIRL